MTLPLRLMIAAVLLAAGGFFLLDSFVYRLYAGTPDRPRGCYTRLELAFGARRPETLRTFEQLLALALPLAAAGVVIFGAPAVEGE